VWAVDVKKEENAAISNSYGSGSKVGAKIEMGSSGHVQKYSRLFKT
jgi:hypothetical protein